MLTKLSSLLSGINTIDKPAARNLYLDVTSTNPMGVTNQEFIIRAALNHQPGPGEHERRNNVLTSAAAAALALSAVALGLVAATTQTAHRPPAPCHLESGPVAAPAKPDEAELSNYGATQVRGADVAHCSNQSDANASATGLGPVTPQQPAPRRAELPPAIPRSSRP
jgi:hypothetical protein